MQRRLILSDEEVTVTGQEGNEEKGLQGRRKAFEEEEEEESLPGGR